MSAVTHDGRRPRLAHATGVAVAVLLWAAAPSGVVAAPVSGPQPADEHVAREAVRDLHARQNETTAAERQRRAESRRAFSGISTGQALQLAIDRHPEFVLMPAWRAPALPDGHRLTAFDNDFVGRVAAPDRADGQLVVSSVPMWAADRDGRKRPVDLSLDRDGEAFRPVNPLAEVRLSERLDEGLIAPGVGLTVRPVGADSPAAPVVSGDSLFYGDAFLDTDVIVRPTVDGFSLNLQVRSAASPERFSLDLDVGDGYELVAAPQRSVIEIRRGGELKGAVTAPVAWDADRRPVTLAWSLDGSLLTIDVEHRDEDLAYPLLVDPDVVEAFEWERYGVDSRGGSITGWTYGWSGNFQNLSWAGNSTWLGNGLYIRNLQWGMGTSALYFNAGDSGWWTFAAPGLARLNRVEWNLFDQDYVDGTCTELGINGPAGWWSGNPSWNHCGIYYNQYAQSWGSGQPGDAATFKVQAVTAGHKPYFASQVGVVYLHLGDSDIPALASGLTENWVNSPATTKLDVWAVDAGLGISEMSLSAPGWSGATIGPETYTRCARTYVCPRSLATDTWPEDSPRNVRIGNMPEGLNEIAVVAKDPAGNQRSSSETTPLTGQGLVAGYYNNADLTSLGAARLDAGIDFNWGAGSPHAAVGADTFSARWRGYVQAPETGTYTFQTSTDDGVRLWVDDMTTPIIDDWRPHGETAREGRVTLTAGKKYRIVMEYYEDSGGAVARLRWRTPSRPSIEAPVAVPSSRLFPPGGWRLKLDRSSPAFDEPSGELWNKRGQALDGDSSVRVTARDGKPAGPNSLRRSGVGRMEVYLSYPGDPVPGVLVGSKDQPADCPVDPAQPNGPRSIDSCPTSYDYTFPASDPVYPEGRYTITFKAFDRAGNPAAEKSWSFIKDSLPPEIYEVTHSPALTNGWIKKQARSVRVKAVDPGTGIKGMTLTKPTPSGPDEDTQENECLGTIASICKNPDDKTFPYHTDELSEGYVDPFVRAYDSARRHSAPSGWRLKVDRSGPTLVTPSGALWDRRNQSTEHRLEGLYDRYYSVQLNATDGANTSNSARRSGVAAINVRVLNSDGDVVINSPDPNTQTCPSDSCSKPRPFTFDTDSVQEDGDYTIEVIAVDQVGNLSAPTTWEVTVDRRGDIYQASAWTADPANAGAHLGEEWVQRATARARVERMDHRVTLSPVTCNSDTSGCLQRRIRTTRADSDPAAADTYVISTGTSVADERLLGDSDLLEASRGDNGAVDGSGPLFDVVDAWQVPPPAHGATYELYEEVEPATIDDQDVDLIIRLYVDVATKLPVRAVEVVGDVVVGTIYYTYAPRRLESHEVAGDFFALSRPAFVSYESSDQLPPDTGGSGGDTPARTVTPAERLERAMGVRRQFGFRADAAYVQTLLADPTRDATIDSWSAPMTAAENVELTRRADVTFARDEIDAYTENQATYSGSYLSHSDGKLHVGFTGAVATHLAALEDIFPYPDRLVVESMAYTRAELATVWNEISDDWDAGELDVYGIASLWIDEKRNRVVIGINPFTEAHRSLLRLRYGSRIDVELDRAEEVRRRKPVRGGEAISKADGGTCTAGFTVTGTAIRDNKRIRQHFKLTAGHCAGPDPDGDADYAYGTRWLSPRGPIMGHWGMTAYPDDGDELDADAGYITLRNGFATSLIVLDRQGERRRYAKVAGTANAARGDTYCWHGQDTDVTTCGEVTGTQYKRPSEGDRTITDQVKVLADHKCAALSGDSGAPTWLPTGQRGEVFASGILGARTDPRYHDIVNEDPPCEGEADFRGIAATPLTRAFNHLNSAGNPLTVLISEGT